MRVLYETTCTAVTRQFRRRWLNRLGTAIGMGLLGLLAWRLDWRQFFDVLGSSRPEFVFAIFLAITLEQVIRGWKWRQILTPVCDCRTSYLFGATMAGYLANLLLPLGLSPLVRAWLVARKMKIPMGCVLATIAIDRLVDGLVFAGIVGVVVLATAIPDPNGIIGLSLLLGAFGSAAAIVASVALLMHHKRRTASGIGILLALADRLPRSLAVRTRSLSIAFADGIVWPPERWRGIAIVLAGIVIKLIAATHLFWAGLAFGILLDPSAYLALVAILGFMVILAHTARVPAGFVLGAVFALGLFGVDDVAALAMVTAVMAANILAVALFGGWGLRVHGVGLGDLGRRKVTDDAGP